MFKKTKTFAKATCILCGAYTCIHVGQALSDPFNSADATPIPIAQVSSDTGVIDYDVASLTCRIWKCTTEQICRRKKGS